MIRSYTLLTDLKEIAKTFKKYKSKAKSKPEYKSKSNYKSKSKDSKLSYKSKTKKTKDLDTIDIDSKHRYNT